MPWPELYKLAYSSGTWAGWYGGNGASAAHVIGDLRESSYAAMFLALCGAYDPNPTRATACRSAVNNAVTGDANNAGWTAQRWPDGSWRSQGAGASRSDSNYVSVAQGSTTVTATTSLFS